MADLKEKLTNTTDSTSKFDENDIQQNKTMSIFAYLSWLVLIPLLAAKESKFARFHCNQGIILAIVEIIAWVVLSILSIIPYVGWIFVIFNVLLSVACLVLAILGIINAVNGKAKELPVVGKIRILK